MSSTLLDLQILPGGPYGEKTLWTKVVAQSFYIEIKTTMEINVISSKPSIKDVSQSFNFWGTLLPRVSSNLLVNVSFLGIVCTPLPPPLGRRLLWMVPNL